MIRMQFRLMINKKEFQLVYLINLVYVFLVYLKHISAYWGDEVSTILSPGSTSAIVWHYNISRIYHIYIILLPFLLVLPFAMSFIDDNKNLILFALQIRSGVKVYYIAKGIVCFIGGFLAFFVPLFMNFILNHVTFPDSGLTFMGDLYDINFDSLVTGAGLTIEARGPKTWFLPLFLASQEGYTLLFCILFSIEMGIFSTFVYVVSFVLKRSKLTLLLPFYLITACFEKLELIYRGREPYLCYSILSYFMLDGWYGKDPLFIGIVILAVLFIIVLGIHWQIRRDQLE